MVRRGLGLAALGLAGGLLAGGALAQALSGLLYGIEASDPVPYVGALGLVVAVSVLSCLAPATTAAKADPAAVLHAD